MSLRREAKTPALKPEEAALLPALPRHLGKDAALKTVMKETKKTERAAYAPSAGGGKKEAVFAAARNRPALRHALRK